MTESAKEQLFRMDTETEFQLQPSSSMLEMLIGADRDRVRVTNLLTVAEPSGQRPKVQ